ncbi:myotubularin-related protein 6 [Corchorus capsularis]|uniref:Myotubularin-related protein 6 n=1 Tax=Corchorus capsularis TaxID=210143 RepID=A0A1R3JYC6_COCAP|nr:myotubularin-related protein 6 [Corchorus capsularis]
MEEDQQNEVQLVKRKQEEMSEQMKEMKEMLAQILKAKGPMEALPALNDQETPEYPPGFAPNQGHGSSTMARQTFSIPTPPQNTYPFQTQYAYQDFAQQKH